MARLTRIDVPPAPKELKDMADWFRRVQRAVTELQDLAETASADIDELEESAAAVADAVLEGDAAGGDLSGTYPDPTVDMSNGLRESGGQELTMATVAANELLQRVGTTIDGIARAGVDSTAIHSGDATGGDLDGTYPTTITVTQARGLRETGGPTTLAMASVADGELLYRSGSTVDGMTRGATAGAWAVITATGDQATIDESTPDLVTAWDTVTTGSTSHGVTVSAGVITLPANTSGYKWQVEAELTLNHTALGTAQFQFYEAPAGANTAIGLVGLQSTSSNTAHISSDTKPIAWLSGSTTVGLRCTSTTSTNTVTLEYEWSRVICREVKA